MPQNKFEEIIKNNNELINFKNEFDIFEANTEHNSNV